MEITIQDVQQFQTEIGRAIADTTMRAITAERRVRELTAEVEALRKRLPAEQSEKTADPVT